MLNRARRTALKTKLRHCREELASGTNESATHALREATRALDREAGRHTIHRNAAARRKGQLARKFNALRAESAAAETPPE